MKLFDGMFSPPGESITGAQTALAQSYTRRLRLGTILGVVLMLAANVVDWSLPQDLFLRLFYIRAAGIAVFLYGLYLLRMERPPDFLTALLLALSVAASTVTGSMIYFTGGYGSHWDMGPGLVILVAGASAHLPARMAAVFPVIGFAGYIIPCVLAGESAHDPLDVGGHLFFYTAFSALSVSFSSFQYRLTLETAKERSKVGQISGVLQQREEELKNQTQEINVHRALIQDADRAQTEFLDNISHELRTPLTSILGFSRLLESSGQRLGEVESEMLKKIHGQGEALLALVENLVDLSSISGSNIKLELRPAMAQLVVHQVADACKLEMAAAGHSLSVECGREEIWIAADHDRLARALSHLVANAIKFTPKGTGRLAIGCSAAGREARIFVRDNGIGMDPDKTGVIFKSFRQLDGSHVRKRGGAGVGLPIVKRVVEKHGGTITVTTSPGKGSEFIITLPAIPAPEGAKKSAVPF